MTTQDYIVDAVLDRNLKDILRELELLGPLEEGELLCPECGKLLTFENIGLMKLADDQVSLICDDHLVTES